MITLFLILTAQASALTINTHTPNTQPPVDLKEKFCARTRADILSSLLDETNQFAFQNDGGIYNQGVCWWHSRFQRSAAHLVIYRPDLAKPKNKKEYGRILADLILMREVVEIPGYSNFFDFTDENEAMIQKVLNFWQIYDGGSKYGWVRGAVGRTHVGPKNLERKMNRLYHQVHDLKLMALQVLQMPGVYAHSWIVIGMKKTAGGYLLKIVDSNRPGDVVDYEYVRGMTNFNYKSQDKDRFVPYINYTSDLQTMHHAIKHYCEKM